MMSAPRVTMLMAVHNGMPFLPEAIESVLSQTLHDFEFLLVDDASTDGSVDCIQSYADPRIRLVCNERRIGQGPSLNRGLALARGGYLARLDQDDRCLPERLSLQVNFLDSRPEIAAVGTRMFWIDARGRRQGMIGSRIDNFGAFLGMVFTRETPIGHPTAMFRRDVLQELGGYDGRYKPCEDYELWCRLALRRRQIFVIPRPLVMVRVHAHQQSLTHAALRVEHTRQAHQQLLVSFGANRQTASISALLGLEDAFWTQHPTRRSVADVLRELTELLRRVERVLGLSRAEAVAFRRRVHQWLARSAFMAIMGRRDHSLPVYGFAWRGGIRMLTSPEMFAYPIGLVCSPFMSPSVGRVVLRLAQTVKRQQYVIRLAAERLRSRFVLSAPGSRSARPPALGQPLHNETGDADIWVMSRDPHVTVLMAVYNGMPYLRQSMASILKQSFTDFECLVIDDASTDGTAACVRSFSDPRVRLLRNEHNIGQVPSLNKGLALARGRLIARMDADDICLPQRFERQVTRLESSAGLAVVGTWMYGINVNGRANALFGERVDDFGSYVGLLSMAVSPICHPSAMFRRDVVRALGGYDASFAPAEDVNLWIRLALHRCRASVIQEPLILYRRHVGQLSAVKANRQRGNVRRSQRRLIGEFCPPEGVEAVSLLLAKDPAFWRVCPTPQEAVRTFEMSRETLARMREGLGMSEEEGRAFMRLISHRLGAGVALAGRIARWPAPLWYPAVWSLSPVLAPIVGPSLSRLPWRLRQVQAAMAARKVFDLYEAGERVPLSAPQEPKSPSVKMQRSLVAQRNV